MSQRLTRTAADTIRAADRVALVYLNAVDAWAIKAYRGDAAGFAHGSESLKTYPSQQAARRAVRRLAPSVELVIESTD
jgi:hypothetical protein